MTLTIVADDLTGACDTGTLFAGRGPVPVTVWPHPPPEGPVRVADTESRALAGAEAAGRVARVAGRTAGHHFKKIDSTLRGRIGAEVNALMRATGARSAVICPALPAQGRIVRERRLLVDGVPVTGTTLARDPEFPARPPADGDVVELLRPQLGRGLAWIPLGEVRAGGRRLRSRLRRLGGTVTVADAESDGDLDALVEAALALDPAPLLVGAAGLGRALAARLGLLGARPALPPGRRWLIVAGSRHPATRRQVDLARRSGIAVLATDEAEEPDPGAAAARLAARARQALARKVWDLVVVTGGETAVALYHALEAERIDLVGAPGLGLALGHLRAPGHPALPLLTKAGGFGAPDLLVALAREAAA